MLILSKDQKNAFDILLQWYKDKSSEYITLGGYAGTGKTTLISLLRSELNDKNPKLKIAFCSYTGKATRVLKEKLINSKSVYPGDNISTIHSLIYSPMVNSKEEIIGWERKDKIKYDLIIVDEASMVDSDIWNDLRSYKVPIIAVGDHGQLPPISGKFNLMEKPMIKLEQIHRQAEGNPIIELSILARKTGKIPVDKFSSNVVKYSRAESETGEIINELLNSYTEDTLVLCGYNTTRVRLNNHIRSTMEYDSATPQRGDRIICLRNNHEKEIYNGMLGTVKSIDEESEDLLYMEAEMDGEEKPFRGMIFASQFGNKESQNYASNRSKIKKSDLFDFGYALTVHKSQGSQSPKVILFEERFKQMDDEMWRRWLYTAVTRAEEELYIIGY